MNRTLWFFHPIFIFVLSILALGTSLFLYIYWYIEVSAGLKSVMHRFNLDPSQVLEPQTWLVVLVLSLLVGIILLGIFTIFVYNQKTLQLYRLQHNFINNFTHELKTPVTSIRLFLETFVKHDLPPPERKKYIGFMLEDVRRLTENINRILNLAKLESKSYEGQFVASDLLETIQNFLADNRHLFAHCRITVHHPPGATYRATIDRPLMEMLLINLINNAMVHNGSDVPVIDIHFHQDKGWHRIQFLDNGIGLERRDIRRIFKKFYQTGRADAGTAKGSGLGLFLVQNIARIHGGKVTAQAKARATARTSPSICPGTRKTGKYRHLFERHGENSVQPADDQRILIIEDETHIAEGLRLNLALQGYAVEIAPDGSGDCISGKSGGRT